MCVIWITPAASVRDSEHPAPNAYDKLEVIQDTAHYLAFILTLHCIIFTNDCILLYLLSGFDTVTHSLAVNSCSIDLLLVTLFHWKFLHL